MKTIEERSAHIAQEFGATKSNKERAIYRACIRMATEQKAIDTKEFLEESLKMLKEERERVKKEMIEKVCEWIEERKHPVLASDTDDTIVGYDVSAIDLLEWLKATEE